MTSNLNKKCILGGIIHTIKFGQLEIIEKGAIIYNSTGIIENIIDLNIPNNKNYLNDINNDNIIDYSDKIIIPGFVDCHCHAPQYVFTGTGMDMDLMDWLKTYTFPVESKFSNNDFAKLAYKKSVQRHLKNGSTFASYYATIHKDAALILADIINNVGQRAFVGKVAMDRNSPDFYIESTEDSINNTESFLRSVLSLTDIGKQFLENIDIESTTSIITPNDVNPSSFLLRPTLLNNINSPLVLPCITPRFIPTCTPESLTGLGLLSYKYGLPVQSHLSESLNEINFVRSLHPNSLTYGHIYHEYGLLHKATLMGHCVHCSELELSILKDTNTSIIHCPSSNYLLGSGIMDMKRYLNKNILIGLGTDVAGGASTSMLDCIRNTITASRSMGIKMRGDSIPLGFQETSTVITNNESNNETNNETKEEYR